MEYQEITSRRTNGDISVDGAGVATIPVGIVTGIVGNTYPQFVAGDSLSVTVEDYFDKKVGDVTTEVTTAINAFIAAKYPNT